MCHLGCLCVPDLDRADRDFYELCLKLVTYTQEAVFSKSGYSSRLRPFSGPDFGVDSGSSIHFGLNLGQQTGSSLENGYFWFLGI